MACRLFSTKPLYEPKLEYYWAHRNKLQWFFLSKFINIHSRQCIKINVWKVAAILSRPQCANIQEYSAVLLMCMTTYGKGTIKSHNGKLYAYILNDSYHTSFDTQTNRDIPCWLYIKFIIPQIQKNNYFRCGLYSYTGRAKLLTIIVVPWT